MSSNGRRMESDIETIKAMILGCASVVKVDATKDKTGTDYEAI